MSQETEPIISFAEFELDTARRRLTRDGKLISLNAKAFDLLIYLAENAGRVLTKEEILDHVWANQFVEEANLTVQISALRKALGESKNEPRFLLTMPGRGYKFVGESNAYAEDELIIETEKIRRLTVTEDYPENDVSQAALLKATASRSFLKNRRIAIGGFILAAALIIIGGGGGYFLLKKETNIFAAAPKFSLKKLTSNGNVRTAALSPDGKLFAFTVEKRNQHSIWLGNIGGGEPIMLQPFAEGDFISLNFSADSNSLFYVTRDNQRLRSGLYKMPVFGGVPEKIWDNIDMPISFSPDGKRFAFVRDDEGSDKSALVVADLTAAAAEERELVVRPIARRLAIFSPSWSPDGSMIFFGALDDAASLRLYTAAISNGEVRPLPAAGSWSYVRSAAWLKDESGILLVGAESNLKDGRWQIYHVSYPDGAARQVNPNLDSYGSSLNLSADGKTLLTIQQQLISNVWIAPADNLSQAKQITFGSLGQLDGWFGLDWTTDGKIFYTSITNNSKTIWKMEANGSNQKQVIPAGDNFYPNITGDHRFIVFQSNRSGRDVIWQANADGGDLRQITADVSGQPTVSPDGKWIVYTKGAEDFGELWRVSIDGGGEPIRLAEKAGWAQISPDGKFVACAYKAGDQPKLAVLSINGGEPLKLFDVAPDANFRGGVRWLPDGKAVAYRDWFDGIWIQPLDRLAPPARLEGLPREKLYAFDWSPDGKFFAYTRGSEIRDVMLINNDK